MNLRLRRQAYDILEGAPGQTTPLDRAIMALILLNLLAIILQTVPSLDRAYRPEFVAFEAVTFTIFLVEYLVRIWIAPEYPMYAGPGGRVRYAGSPMALIDLIAILPPLIVVLVHVDVRFLRVLRLLRLFRVFKLARYSDAMLMLGRVLHRVRAELAIALFVLGVLLVLSSSLMFLVEHEAQPVAFGSIPAAMWWGVATLTTVGYGDIYPVTTAGKMLATVMAIIGIGMFALPTGIISSSFMTEVAKRRALAFCPHCGEKLPTIAPLNSA